MKSCPSTFVDYKIAPEELNVEQFFYTMPANSWDFQHYFRWHSRKNKKKFNTIVGNYKSSLCKILSSSILHDDIKAYVGGLLKNMVS